MLTVRSLLVQTSLQIKMTMNTFVVGRNIHIRSTICIHSTLHSLPIQFILVYKTYTYSHMLHMTPFPTIRHTI